MADIKKPCVDCATIFVFSPAEQLHFKTHNLVDPKRCWHCRQKMKRARQDPDQQPKECFDCTPKYVRGVATDADRRCLACGREILPGGVQYAVIKDRGLQAA